MKGRQKGSPNYTYKRGFTVNGVSVGMDNVLRDSSFYSRCSQGFTELVEKIAEKENISKADVMHKALKCYGIVQHTEITSNLDNLI